ncbi:prepilin-type N-terminal cleavage/methylation domain-containing protein [Aerosakkonema sp. BLCC-F183]|uniref:prepilin-type N-terminal cleavage/methylation domain-containing protein n=1 Tax=Aerosakkonema sp. BLCC-F183 TaxID=3342834 RepID=UPI0035BC2F06
MLGRTHSIQPIKSGRLQLEIIKLLQPRKSSQGVTLLECLVAITVVAVVISSFTPPIFLAVGTRVQNRRAEQALQLAQAEIDRVRRIVEQGSYYDYETCPAGTSKTACLPPKAGISDRDFRRQSKPSAFNDSPDSINATTALRIDINNDGKPDFLMQSYRSEGIQQSGRTVAFNMGVRVYAYFDTMNFGDLQDPPEKAASLKLSTALGAQKKLPLAIIYTSVVKSDTPDSQSSYKTFLENQ